jgi:penicillin-binding protein 2
MSRGSGRLPVIVTIIVSIMLMVMPLPDWALAFRPDWVALILIYWAMMLPRTWSVGSAWIVGLVLDVAQGTILGQHALALCFIVFMTVRFHLLMRVFPRSSCPAFACGCSTGADVDLLSPIKDHHSERRLFIARVVLASVIGFLLLGIVIARLVQLQVFEYEVFAAQSQGNRVRIEAVPPIRGLVFDRQGRVLAENLPAYQLELIPEQVADINDTLQRLAALNLIDAEDIPVYKELSQSGPRFKPVTLNFRLSDEQIANFAIQRPRFPGVDFQPRLVRHYPHGEAVAHAVGYVSALSKEDLKRLDASDYAGTAHTGKTGVENSFEGDLHGDVGVQHVISNALGRQIPTDSREMADSLPTDESPAPGHNVYLSLDLDLQQIATRMLEGRRGAVVALDPWSGEILALVSAPKFDPNLFALGMSSTQFANLQNDLTQPLFNRAVRGAYPPGSTIKPMLALAALESGATNLERRTFCRGYFMLPNTTHRYRD